jgi:hypothetical protein
VEERWRVGRDHYFSVEVVQVEVERSGKPSLASQDVLVAE